MNNIFNIKGTDAHILWNGSSFEYYEDVNEPNSETENILNPNTRIDSEIADNEDIEIDRNEEAEDDKLLSWA